VDTFSKRKLIILGLFFGIGIIFILRLFYLQNIDKTYKQFAANQVMRKITLYPARGFVYDRNNQLMVYNKPAYDLMVIPREVKPFDTTELCRIIQIDRVDLREALRKARNYSRYKPSIVAGQISQNVYAPLQEKLYKYPGFFVQSRTLRDYPNKSAAHVLGYVGEVSPKTIEADKQALEKLKEGKKDDEVPQEEKEKLKELNNQIQVLESQKKDKLSSFGTENKLAKQMVDLALLANNMLKGEALDQFVKRSVELIK